MKSKLFFITLSAVFLFAACENELKLGAETIALHPGESANVNLGESENFEWATNNDFVAAIASGIITANHVGTTTISASNNGSVVNCTVHVLDAVTPLSEPYLEWGVSRREFTDKHGMPNSISTNSDTLFYEHGQYVFSDGLSKSIIHKGLFKEQFETEEEFKERCSDFFSDVDTWLNGRYLYIDGSYFNEKREFATSKVNVTTAENSITLEYSAI